RPFSALVRRGIHRATRPGWGMKMDTTKAPEPTSPELTTTDREALLSRYDILEEIGRGGMGVVYRARHRLLERPVAVKLCLSGTQAQRFLREAKLLASIRSPHIVAVHDFELLADGRNLLVMDLVDGSDLKTLLQENPGALPEETVVPWMRHVCA